MCVHLAGGEEDDEDEDVVVMERKGWRENKEEVELWKREMVVVKVEARMPVGVGAGGEEVAAVERWFRCKSREGRGREGMRGEGEGRLLRGY